MELMIIPWEVRTMTSQKVMSISRHRTKVKVIIASIESRWGAPQAKAALSKQQLHFLGPPSHAQRGS